MTEEIIEISGRNCHLITGDQTPQVIVVKPLGSFEWRCLNDECHLLATMVQAPFAMCAFDVEDMDTFRQPDIPTLDYLRYHLIPYLQQHYGNLPLVLGGYSLGGLFALWCSTQCSLFSAVAACSPSLWTGWWAEYAQTHPPLAQYVYLSVGDTEERTRKEPFCHMGDALRNQHQLHLAQLSTQRCTLEWNTGGHFNDIEMRKAKGFAWCINHLLP